MLKYSTSATIAQNRCWWQVFFSVVNFKNMKWYKSLSIEQKINLKYLSSSICGIQFSSIVSVLGFRLAINTLYEKLKIEGFNI